MFARRFLALHRYTKSPRQPLNVLRRPMSDSHGGMPGENLPCSKCIGKPMRCAMMFILFFGSGFWVPSMAYVYMIYK